MSQQILIENQTHPLVKPIVAAYYNQFFNRLRVLMFQAGVEPRRGIVLVQDRESKIDSAIHMFFCNFELGVVWINNQYQVVDTCLAKRWRPFYEPARPARFVLETHPDHLQEFHIGDQLTFKKVAVG